MTEQTIVADQLIRRFGSFTAVNGVSFTVQPGKIFGFLGPNGAGKSTTTVGQRRLRPGGQVVSINPQAGNIRPH